MITTSEAELPKLLIVGDAGVGKKALLSRILGRPYDPAEQPTVWDIDTRYYTARAFCQIASPRDSTLNQQHEAVLLVFTADQQASYQSCKRWASAIDLEQAEIRLCIANKCDRLRTNNEEATSSRESWVRDCKDWCSEQCFEYVEVSADNLEVDDHLAARDGEQQGVRRVISALHAHTWPGLQMKSQQPSHAVHSHVPAQQGHLQAANIAHEPSANGDAAVPSPRHLNSAVQSDQPANGPIGNGTISAGLSAAVQHPAEPDAPGLHASAADGPVARMPDTLESEDDMDSFERVLNQAATAREHLQSLPDEQRREAAARMAVQFAQMMGLEDSDEDDTADIA